MATNLVDPEKRYQSENLKKKENIFRKESKSKKNSVAFYELFRFTEPLDVVLIVLMLVSSAGVGLATPMNVLVLQDIVNVLVNPQRQPSYYDGLHPMVIRFSIVAAGAFLCGFVQMLCVTITSERQGRHYKRRYFSALMRQDVHWFDGQRTEDLMKKLNDDIESIQVTIVDKLSFFVQQMAIFLASVTIGFVSGWDLALVACSVIPLMVVTFAVMIFFVRKYTLAQARAYGVAGKIALDILSGIQVVMAFNNQSREIERYSQNLHNAERYGVRRALSQGICTGVVGFSTFAVASLVFFLGLIMVQEQRYLGGVVVLMFLAIVLGSIVLGNAALLIETFLAAQVIAYPLFQVIDRKPAIDFEKPGVRPDTFDADIVFKDVNFQFTHRGRITVLENFNLTIPHGKTVGIIGPPGSGKSAIIHLLQRLYDPETGSISYNGIDLRDLDLGWYRSNISVLNEVPILFDGTIEENIHLGNKSASHEEIIQAADQAMAKEFIENLKEKFKTRVDDIATGLTTGQKQLISVATALLRKPQMLLIDKALAGLDIDSEKAVEESVFRAISSEKRTVVFAAHYLKYVRNADVIVVMKSGNIVEQGCHEELLDKRGLYYKLLDMQRRRASEKEISMLPQLIRKFDVHTRKFSIKITDGNTHNSTLFASVRRKTEMHVRRPSTHETMKKEDRKHSGIHKRRHSFPSVIRHKKISKISLLSKRFSQLRSKEQSPPEIFQIKKGGDISPNTVKFQLPNDFSRIMKIHRKEFRLIALAVLASILVGISFPAAAAIYAQMFQVMTFKNNMTVMFGARNTFCGLMLLPAIVLFVGQLIKSICLGKAGEALTTRIRKKLLTVMVKQEMKWFDKPENAMTNLTSLLSTEASLVKGMASIQLCIYVEVIATIVAFFALGLSFSWMLTLLLVFFIPIIIMAGVMQGKLSSNQRITWTDSQSSNALLRETLSNIKLIQAFGLQQHFCDKFDNILTSSGKSKKWKLILYGLLNAICSSALSFAFCAVFHTGSLLIDQRIIEIINLTRVFAIISISSVTLGRTLSLTPDIERATRAARKVLTTLDQKSDINNDLQTYENSSQRLCGNIEFKGIYFRYPVCLNVPVLQRFDLKIKAGERVVLVGHFGCGKSTVTRLLGRYYDPLHGSISVDGIDLRSMDLNTIRSQILVVNRNSYLFDRTILDNIAYGTIEPIKLLQIHEAARKANIHDFIMSLPDGYDTKVGQNNSCTNASIRQRICIARAFYRRPQIWILDGATSDIDLENERSVQEALDREMEGRTCIIVPDKYSTIRNSDKVVVIEKGMVKEVGTHKELLEKRGRYYELKVQHIE